MNSKVHFQEIDFIKGIAIISVILLHTLSADIRVSSYAVFHIGQAVPIFIVITFFLSFYSFETKDHSLKEWFSAKRMQAIFKRIILPVFFINSLQILVMIGMCRYDLIFKVLRGGYGPGAYYMWVYLQLWILMPFIYNLMNLGVKWVGAILMLGICVLLNILLNEISQLSPIVDKINSFLCLRYLFLAAIAWIWLHKDVYNRYVIYSLSLMSFVYLLYVYYGYDTKPFVYSGNWASQNYPVYFWTYILIITLWHVYDRINIDSLKKLFCWMGKNSWEIFVMQMFILGFLKFETCIISSYQVVNQIFFVLIGIILSILPIFFYQKIKGKYLYEKYSDNTCSRRQ